MDTWKILVRFILFILVHQVKISKTERVCTKLEGQKICSEDVEEALRFAMDYISKKEQNFPTITNNETADLSSLRRKETDPYVRLHEERQEPYEIATDFLILSNNLTEHEKVTMLPNTLMKGIYSDFFNHRCGEVRADIHCDPTYQYRSPSGQCNNLLYSRWGSTLECYQRMLKPHYVGATGIRFGMDGKPLPNPRSLTINIHTSINHPWHWLSHMYVFFGQLLSNDIAMTPISTTVNNEPIQCCPLGNQSHPQCEPIIISEEDPFYSHYGIQCLNFVRSSICPTCKLGAREQMNQVTSFVDASFVYGNSKQETDSLRQFLAGRLKVQNKDDATLLPALNRKNSSDGPCVDGNNSQYCFLAGDSRVNQHTMLTILHILFVREHNRIASHLEQMNPTWEEETIFQETRRIVGAEMQAITYNEYLPLTLGEIYLKYFNLQSSGEETTVYDSTINPNLFTEFTTAAFRFGHSLINSKIAVYPKESNNTQKLLRDDYFQPFEIYKKGTIEYLLTMSMILPSQFFDQNVVADVSHFLFRKKGQKAGLDLAAIDIQRGRDHGLPPYVDVLQACAHGKIEVNKFDDLMKKKLMTQENILKLKESYRHVQDIDLWTGILSESPLLNAVVGPTAACVIGLQFHKLKFGDRFYFEHENELVSFTPGQIQQLKKSTLSMIICSNTKVREIVTAAMLSPSEANQVILCTDVPRIDLSPWKALR